MYALTGRPWRSMHNLYPVREYKEYNPAREYKEYYASTQDLCSPTLAPPTLAVKPQTPDFTRQFSDDAEYVLRHHQSNYQNGDFITRNGYLPRSGSGYLPTHSNISPGIRQVSRTPPGYPPQIVDFTSHRPKKHGKPPKTTGKSIIKPIAFKPVLPPSNRYNSSPKLTSQGQRPPSNRSHDHRLANHSQDEGYASQEYNTGSHSHSTSNTSSNVSQGSYHSDTERGHYHSDTEGRGGHYGGEHYQAVPPRHTDTYTSPSASSRHSHSNHGDTYLTTPSPSDSGVGEVEAMLRDKDAEIQHLRETMEKNENAIMQVYQEKKQNWEIQIKDINDNWERRLRLHQQKAFKMEQALLLQLFKLQQERKNLRLEVEQVRTEKERAEQKSADLENEIKQTNAKLEEVQWEMCQKSGEISLLKSQLKESKTETTGRSNEMLSIRSQLKEVQQQNDLKDKDNAHLREESEQLRSELSRLTQEATRMRVEVEQLHHQVSQPLNNNPDSPSGKPPLPPLSPGSPGADASEVEHLRHELHLTQLELDKQRFAATREKEQWLEEKNKVIHYQKHLQLNYVQMLRKNKMLEAEVEQLMVEIENKDITLDQDNPGSPVQQESTC